MDPITAAMQGGQVPDPNAPYNPSMSTMSRVYGQVAQPGPTPTGNPVLDMGMQFAAPMIGSAMGMQNPQFLPQTPRGTSAWEGLYMRDVQLPIYQASQQQYMAQWGGAVGSTMAKAAQQFGARPDLEQTLVAAGQSDPGRMVTQMLMGTGAMQSVMGGDPLRMHDMIYNARTAMAGSALIDPNNITAQTAVARQATQFSTALTQAMYGRPDGKMGVTPNYEFTRGFAPEEMGTIVQQMATRNAPGFGGAIDTRGMSPQEAATAERRGASQRVESVRQMSRTLEALSDVMGGGTATELFQQLDKLTNMQWNKVDRGALERGFREMSATARALGVSGSSMLNVAEGMRQGIGLGLGVSAEAQSMGVSAGGYQQLPVTDYMAKTVMGAAKAAGVQNDPRAVAQIAARQEALLNTGLNSSLGKDTRMMAWLAQTGQIGAEDWEAFQRSGSTEQSRDIANRAYKRAFVGGPAEARRMMNDPAVQTMINQETDAQFAGAAVEKIMDAQRQEFDQRVNSGLLRQEQRAGRALMQGTGRQGLNVNERAQAQAQATLTYLGDVAASNPELREQAQSVYQQALSSGKTEAQAMRQMQTFINQNPAFAQYRGGIRQMQQEAMQSAETEKIMKQSPEMTEETITRAQMRTARAMDPSLASGLKDIEGTFREANKAERRGDTAAAGKLREEAQSKWDAMRGSMTTGQQKTMDTVRDAETKRLHDMAGMATGAHAARTRVAVGRAGGMDTTEVAKEQLAVYEALARPGLSYEDQEKIISSVKTLDPTDRAEIMDAITQGPGTEAFNKARDKQRNVLNSLRRQKIDTAVDRRIAGIEGALGERKAAGEILKEIGPAAKIQAERDAVTSDIYAGLKATMPQLLVGAVTGEVSVPRLLGLEDMAQVKEVFGGTGKDIEKALGKVKSSQADVEKSITSVVGLADDSELFKTGIADKALKATHEMGKLAGSKDGITSKDFARIKEDMEKSMDAKGVSKEARAKVMKALEQGRKSFGGVEEAQKQLKELAGDIKPEVLEKADLMRRVNERKKEIMSEEAAPALAEEKVGKYGGAFAESIDLSKMDTAGALWGSKRNALAKDLEIVTGRKDIKGWFGTDRGDLESGLKQVAALKAEDIEKLDPEKKAALGRIAAVATKQRKDAAGEKGAAAEGDGKGITLSGTLVIYDQSGNQVGIVKDLKRK